MTSPTLLAPPSPLVAVYRYLAMDADLLALLGSSPAWPTWLWRRDVHENVQGSGQCAVVLGGYGSWSAMNQHNTMRFPRLQVEVFADPDRDVDDANVALAATGEDKAWPIVDHLIKLLHITPQGGAQWWGGTDTQAALRVQGCQAFTDGQLMDVPNADGLVDVAISFGLVVG